MNYFKDGFILTTFLYICLLSYSCSTGPVYRDTVDYMLPNDANGPSCINECDSMKLQCEMLEQMKAERAEKYAKQDYLRCVKSGNAMCIDTSRIEGKVDRQWCTFKYDRCFKRCGGKIKHNRVCVRNCSM